MIITATEYHARVLRFEGTQAMAFREWAENQLKQQGLAILSVFEEEMRWHDLVQNVPLSNKKALVAACMDAFKTMLLYQIPFSRLDTFEQENVVLFRDLLKRFLKKNQPTFLEALSLIPAQAGVQLFGFVDFPPLYQQVLKPPLARGDERSEGGIQALTLESNNPENEFLTALSHIETEWQQNPHKKFALVVQQSELSWKTIHRLLKTHQSPLKISCSKGEVAADQPKFQFIKDLFETLNSKDLMLMSRVLTSVFWGEDLSRRLELDRSLRENMLSLSSLTQVLKQLFYQEPSIAETRWFQTWSKLASFNRPQAEEFGAAFLQAAEFVNIKPSPETKVNLHIVGALEAANLPVDAVWLLAADSKHYPLGKSTPLFLPKILLAEYGVPIGLEERYRYGEAVLQAITAGKTVYASFVSVARGEQKKLSPLLKSMGQIELPSPVLPEFRVQDRRECEKISALIPLLDESKHLIKGGSALLKDQAECPFRAFAHFRLKATALKAGQDLLGPMQKGLVVHSVLEKIWNELKSQQSLIALSAAEREELIVQKVDETLNQINVPARRGLIRQLEKQRLIRLTREWLNLEIERPPFQVLACEVKEMVALSGLQFRLRVDRIDEVAQGKLIIDYKTGEVSAKGWFDERLCEPQLPLYVVGNQAEGAVFASLKVGKMGFVGVVKDAEAEFGRVKAIEAKSWEAQRAEWKSQLETLAEEFQQGRADVSPMDESVCLYCDLSSFCRVKEKNELKM